MIGGMERGARGDAGGVDVAALLRRHGIRPTRPRRLIAGLMLSRRQHLSAEQIRAALDRGNVRVSTATVYNTLALLRKTGLVHEVIVDPQRRFFDSNTTPHHHFYNEDTGEISDVPAHGIRISGIPELPPDTRLGELQLIVRVSNLKE